MFRLRIGQLQLEVAIDAHVFDSNADPLHALPQAFKYADHL
jgi:hypothetical protein